MSSAGHYFILFLYRIQPPQSNNDDFGYGNGEDLYEPLDNDPVGSEAFVNPSLSPNTIPTGMMTIT